MKGMLCDNCKHLWHMYPDYTSPYGEHACMKLQCDLPFFEIVSECEHFDPTEPPSEAAAEIGGTHD